MIVDYHTHLRAPDESLDHSRSSRRSAGGMQVKLGLGVDYEPNKEEQTRDVLAQSRQEPLG